MVQKMVQIYSQIAQEANSPPSQEKNFFIRSAPFEIKNLFKIPLFPDISIEKVNFALFLPFPRKKLEKTAEFMYINGIIFKNNMGKVFFFLFRKKRRRL